jgi:hypothetical protein
MKKGSGVKREDVPEMFNFQHIDTHVSTNVLLRQPCFVTMFEMTNIEGYPLYLAATVGQDMDEIKEEKER